MFTYIDTVARIFLDEIPQYLLPPEKLRASCILGDKLSKIGHHLPIGEQPCLRLRRGLGENELEFGEVLFEAFAARVEEPPLEAK